ncbi:hypothetical protein BDZ45DRAFT_749854 [Acephala macrosclerotiorum]|nr:hypothetical protein BDZ45DRAFT_749854 [Acephala macrosclerotiorum]
MVFVLTDLAGLCPGDTLTSSLAIDRDRKGTYSSAAKIFLTAVTKFEATWVCSFCPDNVKSSKLAVVTTLEVQGVLLLCNPENQKQTTISEKYNLTFRSSQHTREFIIRRLRSDAFSTHRKNNSFINILPKSTIVYIKHKTPPDLAEPDGYRKCAIPFSVGEMIEMILPALKEQNRLHKQSYPITRIVPHSSSSNSRGLKKTLGTTQSTESMTFTQAYLSHSGWDRTEAKLCACDIERAKVLEQEQEARRPAFIE